MSDKICSRCSFTVKRNRQQCQACGHSKFRPEALPFAAPSEESLQEIVESLRKMMSAFVDDVKLTIKNSKSASRKIAQLIRGR